MPIEKQDIDAAAAGVNNIRFNFVQSTIRKELLAIRAVNETRNGDHISFVVYDKKLDGGMAFDTGILVPRDETARGEYSWQGKLEFGKAIVAKFFDVTLNDILAAQILYKVLP